jgi:hypothetical protein
MNDENLKTIEQVRQFLEGSEETKFKGITVEERIDKSICHPPTVKN